MDRGMYVETIQDYARHPRNFGTLEQPDISHEESNPLCGDVVRIDLQVGPGGRVEQARFTGRGCAISQASASMLTERIQGLTLDEVKAISKQEILDMLGVPISMARLKCALLGLKVLKAGAYGITAWPGEEEDEAWPTTSR
jgi:nitrogen fixation NifU-like protein